MKNKVTIITYADFESILLPKENAHQNPQKLYTSILQKYIACSYRYKLVWVDDKFSNPLRHI